jgi:ABC-type branched-subunit amino acid transport system substrate-binding protein
VKPQTTLAALAAIALLAAGCGRSGSGNEATPTGSAPQAVSGDFGDLKSVCRPGTTSSAPTQGVTAKQINVGVFSDVGFTKNPEFVNAAKVFTSWCNAAGGINGRKLVADVRDTQMLQVDQQMLAACRQDFALVGGGAALDALGVKDRLKCLLPDFPAQTSMAGNVSSGLQAFAGGQIWGYSGYQPYFQWLFKTYPGSVNSLGLISGDSPVTKPIIGQDVEGLKAAGGKVVYNDLYPATGVSDWTPYAQSIKSKGVKGLIFLGDYLSLSKLEQILTGMNYKLDWIDANSNAYGPAFIKLAGSALSSQNNLADLAGVADLEGGAAIPAVKQIEDLYAKYAPRAQVTFPTLRAFSAWLLFAKSAVSCGDALTRTCVYQAAAKETAWTGGGLQAPVDPVKVAAPRCFNLVQATTQGWKPATGFKPDTGPYQCDNVSAYKLKGNYGAPVTLADVGKSLSDLK